MTMNEKSGVRRFGELVLNAISIAAIAFMGLSLLARQRTETTAGAPESVQLGDRVALDGVNWKDNARTLVIALQVGCRFCADSSPFYQALLRPENRAGWSAVAVLPQPELDAKQYMEGQGYAVPTVRQVNLGTIGVTGTPTLLLVDSEGKLLQQWIGALTPEDEADVAAHLGIKSWTKRPVSIEGAARVRSESPLVTTAELLGILGSGAAVNLIDVRERALYAKNRIRKARNIPLSELSVRAPHELRLDAPTVMYCGFSPSCAASGIPSVCSEAAEKLKNLGITRVRVVRDPLNLLSEAGVPTEEGSPAALVR